VERDELPINRSIKFTNEQQQQRRALTNLLCNMELVDYTNFLNTEGGADELTRLENDGVIEVIDNRAVVTPQGRYMLHHMLGGVSAGYNPPPAAAVIG
jgi:coproporphyrinogen III oxidase-like Fe-S oxidoreductase